ncbi:phosphate acetyltransferase [Balneolaceae bacterium YR4-1]|uniref:phosphate acetyltransferase n=1 Tax=Halalkalibaculum roseum TaxID=2709311 RepID=A0A6M1SN13_9BACT|nr:phosphate acetyltransferase [Halalkalibaculum roseum]NGP76439.1 phosphate acetyltransferase [Halalkalibaculum roseum]
MDLIKEVTKRVGKNSARIVFPEPEDRRVLKAAEFLSQKEICSVILIGQEETIISNAKNLGIHLAEAIEFIDPASLPEKAQLVSAYVERNKTKNVTETDAETALESPLYIAASLVAAGLADGCVAGSVATTGDVIRSALKCIGLAPHSSIVSSIFLMNLKDGKTITYGDCGVVPYPDSDQLADIAIDSARTHTLLTGAEPIVAMLSFSTKGSASHESIELVTRALSKVKKKNPDLVIDGELQFDAAFVPDVAQRKAPDSKVAGKANVFIFPNLDAGNIAYKITERLAGAEATGPILQGLNKPVMDLSRGCDWKDIVNAACVAILKSVG